MTMTQFVVRALGILLVPAFLVFRAIDAFVESDLVGAVFDEAQDLCGEVIAFLRREVHW